MGKVYSTGCGKQLEGTRAFVETQVGILFDRTRSRLGKVHESENSMQFEDTRSFVETQVGKVPLHTRYHREPRTLETDYDMCSDVLGSGVNGVVRLATSRLNSSQKVAVKSFRLENMRKEGIKSLTAELGNYLIMDHPHIARLLDVYESKDHLHLVMECMEGGEVFDRVEKRKKFTEKEASEALRQMLLAINYMHTHGYVHRDIKLENFVYDADDSDYLKLIDFGFSRRWDPSSQDKMHDVVGTLSYCAPEVLKGSYTSQCDLWSLGVVGFILVCGKMPFYGNDKSVIEKILTGSYDMGRGSWCDISAECKEFLQSLLHVDPHRRLSAQEALEHPWIANSGVVSEQTTDIMQSLRQYRHSSELQRSCLQALAWSSSKEDQAMVRNGFLALNTSQKGSVTFEELQTAMLKQFPSMEMIEFEEICHALDHNHDQRIRYSDFLAAMMGSQISLSQDTIASAFRRLDVENSGIIMVDDSKRNTDALEVEIAAGMIQEVSKIAGAVCFQQFSSHAGDQYLSWYRALCVVLQASFV